MNALHIPSVFQQLISENCITPADILSTEDGFFMVNKSLSDILAEKDILDFPDSSGQILPCRSFFDDWFLYAVPAIPGHVCSLLKLREQEQDARDGAPADGDIPGVTISFVSFKDDILFTCLADPSHANRQALNSEINRVVVRRGQRHHLALKLYFINPTSHGSYLVAQQYVKGMARLAKDGALDTPECYQKLVQQSISYKSAPRFSRLPRFVAGLNEQAGRVICDNKKLYIRDPENPDPYTCAAILATHTGNTSVFSFAAEVEYHAKFLIPLARIKIPFFGRSVYESAIRADMSVGDAEFQGTAPFYRGDSAIVKRQYQFHKDDPICF